MSAVGGIESRAARADVRRLLRRTAMRVRGPLFVSVLGALLRQCGFLAAPYLLSIAIDRGVVAGDLGATALWCALIAAAAIAQFVGLCVWDYFGDLADARAGSDLRRRARDGVVALSIPADPGDLLVRAGRDVDLVRVWVRGLPTWGVIPLTIGILVPGLAALDPWLLVVACATVPCLVLLTLVYPRRFERASAQAAEAHGRRASIIGHILTGHSTIRGIGAEDEIVRRHRSVSAELAARTVRSGGILARWLSLGEGIPAVATAVGVLVGATAVLDGRLTVGGIVTFTGWMATVGVAVQIGLMRWTQSVDARVGAARLVLLLHADGGGRTALVGTNRPQRISLQAVSPAEGLRPVDVEARAGQLVVVVGPVASGKSRLLEVIAGIREPASGTILVDGSALEHPIEGVRIVPQRPLVASGTVRDDLALGLASDDPDADDQRYREVLAQVGLAHELRGRAADVLDVPLGEAGSALSGGQRQRLALARSLVADPAVLLLDDVTSAVDPATSTSVASVIRQAAASRIVIATGHDPRLIARADALVNLAGGRADDGPTDDAQLDSAPLPEGVR